MKKSIKTIACINFASCVFLLIALAVPAAAQPIAIVTDLTGKAVMEGAVAQQAVSILSEVNTGARLQLDNGTRLVVLYVGSGVEYAFSGPALIEFRGTAPEVTVGAKPQKQPGTAGKRPDIRIKTASTAQAGYVMRSGHAATRLKLLSPVSEKILETAPEFRWADLQPGVKYQFDLADETGKSLYETGIEGASLKLPSSALLKEGVGYTWQVSVRLSDGRRYSNVADFSVATAELRARAESLRPASGVPVSERVLYAMWLEQEGLRGEARKYWSSLALERPKDAKLKVLATY